MANIQLTPPPVMSGNAEKQLSALYSYLYQMSEQINVAVNSLGTGIEKAEEIVSKVIKEGSSPSGSGKKDTNDAWNELRSLIRKNADSISTAIVSLDGLNTDLGKTNQNVEKLNGNVNSAIAGLADLSTGLDNTNQNIEKLSDDVNSVMKDLLDTNEQIQATKDNLDESSKALWEETARIMGVMTDGFEAASEATSRVVDGYLTVEVADSKYGTAIDDLAVVVEENARGYNERFAAVSALSDKLGELGKKITASEGNILRGVVEYDENNVPVIGIAIGQDIAVSDVVTIDGEEYAVVDRTKFVATYTSKAVKFWTDNKLVAYMANNKLYILEAELINRLVLNNFEQCVVPSHGFIIKYTGD